MGIEQFRSSTEVQISNQNEVQVNGRNVEIEEQLISRTTTLASGSTETINLFAPTGFIAKPFLLSVRIPSTGGTSKHHFYVNLMSGANPAFDELLLLNSTGGELRILNNDVFSGTLARPSTIDLYNKTFLHSYFNDTKALTLKYNNNSGLDNTGTREYYVVYFKEKVI